VSELTPPTNLIRVHVLLFGACREAAGSSELEFELTAPATVNAAFAALTQQLPQLAHYERSALFAVNEEHARPHQALRNGDTLAIFPPVSGG